jgi:hypothetical protein
MLSIELQRLIAAARLKDFESLSYANTGYELPYSLMVTDFEDAPLRLLHNAHHISLAL